MTIERDAVRRRRNRLIASLSELAAPALRAIARRSVRGRPAAPADWRTLAIFGANHIGDVLFRSASLPVLRRALPNCRILFLCTPVTVDLVAADPNVDEALPLGRDGEPWRSWRPTLDALRERQIDAALCTDALAYHGDLLLAIRAGIPARVGFAHKGFSGLLTHVVAAKYPRPYAAYTRALVADLLGVNEDWSLRPLVYPGPRDEQDAVSARRELGLDEARPVVACTMTVRQPDAAVWPAERYLETLDLVARRHPIQVVLCGSAADAPYLARAASLAPASLQCRVMAGRLSLLGFAAFLSHCDALLASDSGPRHIANAVGTPVVFTRSLNVSRVEAGAYCDGETEVSPDGEFLSRPAQIQALKTLRPTDVALALGHALTRAEAWRSGPG
ncbi:MAG TPA: glycosyltransferase family 9 protein [Gemmatimonadaceae bacterium]|nr:glycosyltransferase family 9 protein [Gemmatimonadaceae bacterium]